jgi:hypothetical protein
LIKVHAVPPQQWHKLKTPEEAAENQSLFVALKVLQGTPPSSSKNFVLGVVSSRSSSRDPTNSSQELVQTSYFRDPALAVRHEFKPQVPAGRSKNAECKKGTLPVMRPIPYVPPTNLHEKQETEQIKVELPDRTKFQMPTYGSGNNEEYLVYIIAVL